MWNENKSKIEKEYEKKEFKKVFKPSKYRGIYHNLKLDLEKETKKLRDELDKNMKNYLLDTNILIYYLAGAIPQKELDKIENI